MDISKFVYYRLKKIEMSARNYTKNPLVFLSEYLACKDNNRKFTIPAKYEIEHIMPRSGQNIDHIRVDAGIIDKEELSEVVNKIGNKILLEEDVNRSIGNAWFSTKIQSSVKERKEYKDSCFTIAKQIVSDFENQKHPLWTVKDI